MTMVSQGNELQAEDLDETEEQRRRSFGNGIVEDPHREEKNMSAGNQADPSRGADISESKHQSQGKDFTFYQKKQKELLMKKRNPMEFTSSVLRRDSEESLTDITPANQKPIYKTGTEFNPYTDKSRLHNIHEADLAAKLPEAAPSEITPSDNEHTSMARTTQVY